ncbi:MAG: Flp pilus assembly protein TadD [Myxococcota bacterium]|jgi:Flp pilus assembly protein TadD
MIPLLILLGACANRPPPETVAPAPEWTTEEGQEKTRLELVESMLESNHPDAALTLLNQIHASGISSPELTMLQARALRAIGLQEDAEALLMDLTKRHRRMPAAYNELGILAMDRSETIEAIPRFERACRLDRDNPEYANNLGFALMSAGRSAEAVEVLRGALLVDATRVRTRNNLGFALVADDRAQEAYRVFRSASSEDQARYNLGVGLELRGEFDDAALAYSSALKHNPDHESAQQALMRLRVANTPSLSPEE